MNVKEVAAKGRGGDTQLAHVMKGETLIPPGVMTPELRAMLHKQMLDAGIDPATHTVGEGMSINPDTGLPEFGFFKKVTKFVSNIVDAVPAGNILLPAALSYFGTPVLGASLGGGAAGTIGAGALIGGASGALTGGNILQGAAAGGLSGALNSAASGALDNTALGRGISDAYSGSALKDIYTGATGALNSATSGVSDLYNGSSLQDAFKSGGDALKSIGIDTSGLGSSPAPVVGGGASSYSGSADNSLLGKDFSLGKADFGSTALDSATNSSPFTTAALNGATGATQVAGSTNYTTPLLSALLGSNANSQAKKALLASQQQNQALLSPYANGFSFTPGDLTQDPGYQFNLQQGTQAADRAQLARGGYFSGDAAKELAQFNQGLADNTYNTAFNRALQGNQAGLTGALANAGINTDIGNIKANASTNQGNLFSGALGSLLGGTSFTNTGALQGGSGGDLLTQLLKKQYASQYGTL